VPPAPEAVPPPISVTTPATAEALPAGFSETIAAAKVRTAAAVIDVRLDIL